MVIKGADPTVGVWKTARTVPTLRMILSAAASLSVTQPLMVEKQTGLVSYPKTVLTILQATPLRTSALISVLPPMVLLQTTYPSSVSPNV